MSVECNSLGEDGLPTSRILANPTEFTSKRSVGFDIQKKGVKDF